MEHQIYIQGIAQKVDSAGLKPNGMLEYYAAQDVWLGNRKASAGKVFDPILCKYDLDKIAAGILQDAPSIRSTKVKRSTYWESCHIRLEEIDARKTSGEKLDFIYNRIYDYLRDYENSRELTSLTKKDITHVMENLYMIYNTDDKEIRDVVQLIHLISQNVISKYIQIEGLERLFNEQYIDFEWEMHLGMDHKQQTMKFYRDHFIHQVRDAYMMDRLLRDCGFFERTLNILRQSSNSKVSRYFCKMVERQRELPLPNATLLKYDKGFVPRNIIYMASYMAGLFHDIGYPDTYLQSLRRRISAFAPGLNPGNPTQDTLPDNIFSLLQNSLLFRLVPFEEIQTRVYQNSIDHGTLSAIAFLLHFYQNGIILMLPPYQAAAVELAALAIYNHTYVYNISEPSKKTADDYRPRFLTNPISYLLRLCDDLQEWDRVYFEISSHSNLITCNRCHTPIVGQRRQETKDTLSYTIHDYVCNCYTEDQIKDHGGAFSRTFDGKLSFPYRRLYNIEICNWVQLVDLSKRNFDQESRDLCFRLNYDPYKLLHIVYISPSYARYRIKELNSLKPLLLNQVGLPRIWLDYFVTANPILLKTRLLEEYIQSHKEPSLKKMLRQLPRDESNLAALNIVLGELLKLFKSCLCLWDADPNSPEEEQERMRTIHKEIERSLELYCLLYIYGQMYRREEKRPEQSPQWIADEIYKRYSGPDGPDEFKCLLGDSLLQLSRLYTDTQLLQLSCIPDAYMQQFAPGNWKEALTGEPAKQCSEEFYHHALEWYVNQNQYKPVSWPKKTESYIVDAFTDLGFFQMLYTRAPF